MRKILSGLLCCFIMQFALAQAENEGNIRELIKVPMPPSPNASAIGKFGEIPVGLSTGIPSITVPIFSWSDQLKELSFDVSLNYHAGGHKVEDMPSNVGLGWALNAGGVVSRTVRGLPDDGTGGYLNTSTLPNLYTEYQEQTLPDPPLNPALGLTVNNSAHFYTARYINDRSLDGEFDIWNLNAGNISARFFIDKNGVINFFTQTNISLSYTRSPGGVQPITKFTLVDDRAITYLFDVTEGSESIGQQTVPGQIGNGCISSYYLSKIISADKKDTIFLNYSSPGDLYYEAGFSQTYRVSYSTSNGAFDVPDIDWTYSTNHTYSQVRISSVNLPDGTLVSFAYNFARADYYGDAALTEVSISNAGFSKKFNLSYNYFTSDSDPGAGSMSSVNDYSKRLKLLQVQEISGTDSLPPYIFEYNSQNLPPRHSRAQDHWGYFRGYSGGSTSLTPQYTFTPGVPNPPPIGIGNRYPQEQYCKASVLEKIIYPTGGYTRFTYHINDSQTDLYNTSSAIQLISLDETMDNSYQSLPLSNRNNDTVLFSVQLYNNLPLPDDEPWSEDCPIVVTIKSTDNAVTRTIETYYAAALNGVLSTVILPLNKTYQIKYESGCTWLEDFSVSLTYQFWFQPNAKNVGGLRVEKIEDNDSLGNKIFTEYSYKTYDNKSSGNLQHIPNYSFYKSATRFFLTDYKVNWTLSASPTQSLSFFRGSPVLYTRVKVNKSTPTTNIGYSIYEFTGNTLIGSADYYYPFVQTQDAEWRQGLALRDSIFNSSNQLVKLVRKEWQLFDVGGDSAKWRNMITGLIYNDGDATLSHYVYAAKTYTMSFGRAELKKETDVIYSLGDSIKTITEYTYDPNKYLMTKKKTYNSLGEEIETRLYYPFNYSITTDEKTSSVIAKEVFKKQDDTWYITNGLVNEFAQFNGTFLKQKKMIAAELVSPVSESTVGTFNPAVLVRHSSFKDQVEFLSYDAKGRYTELKTMNKPVTSLIWCSTKNYPMAIVENASYENSAYTSFETADAGNWSGIEIGNIQTAIAATGSKYYQQTGFSISKPGLTNSVYYIVSYWSKNGSYSITGTQSGYPKTLRIVGSGGDTWTLYEHLVTGQTTITLTGTGSIDELRLYPRGSQMVTYTFKPLAGINSQCDANNKIIHYEYDGLGRLLLVRDQDKNILKKIEYKYRYTVQ